MGPVAHRRLAARFPNVASRAFWSAFDFILPPDCVSCRQTGDVFCGDCRALVARIRAPVCRQCGFPARGDGHHVCPACHDEGVGLAGLRSAALYTGTVRPAILGLKYRRNRALVHRLGPLLVEAWPDEFPPNALLAPVPLAPGRMRTRGFNQAALLAQYVGRELGLRVRPRALRRTRETPPQVGMTRAERRRNMQSAFQASPRQVRDRTIILIDDVCTTGATTAACAAALYAAGSGPVWGMTVARAGGHIQDS
ncbi:MAG: ComF family protein [Anaerolineales bacterium]